MEAEFELSTADYTKITSYGFNRMLKIASHNHPIVGHAYRGPVNRSIALVLFTLLFSWAIFSVLDYRIYHPSNVENVVIFGVSLLCSVIALYILFRIVYNKYAYEKDGVFRAIRKFRMTPEGFIVESELFKTMFDWRTIQTFEENDDYLFLFVDNSASVVVPKYAFSNDDSLTSFKVELEYYLHSTREIK